MKFCISNLTKAIVIQSAVIAIQTHQGETMSISFYGLASLTISAYCTLIK